MAAKLIALVQDLVRLGRRPFKSMTLSSADVITVRDAS